jgi:hypothetical protein
VVVRIQSKPQSVSRLAKNAKVPRSGLGIQAKNADVMRLQKLMPLPNPIQLIRYPAGADASNRHQHKQRSQ